MLRINLLANFEGIRRRKNPVHAFFTPAGNHVITFINFGDEFRQLIGIVLQVAIHGDDHLAAGVVKTGGKRGRLAEIAAKVDHQYMRVAAGDGVQAFKRVIARAVVDVNDFVGFFRRGEEGEIARQAGVKLLN